MADEVAGPVPGWAQQDQPGEQPVVTMTVLDMPADGRPPAPDDRSRRPAAVLAAIAGVAAIAGSWLPLQVFALNFGGLGDSKEQLVETAWGMRFDGRPTPPGLGLGSPWGVVLVVAGGLLALCSIGLLAAPRRTGLIGSLLIGSVGLLVGCVAAMCSGMGPQLHLLFQGGPQAQVGAGLYALVVSCVLALVAAVVCARRNHRAETAAS